MANANWGDIATWVTGAATVLLFGAALYQIYVERLARIRAERKLEERQKRQQAEQISSWIVKEVHVEDGDWAWITVLNRSSQPVYQVIVSLAVLTQSGESRGEPRRPERQACIGVAPPGQGYIRTQANYGGMHRRVGVEIAFKDGTGRNWVRTSNGELSEIMVPTVVYCEVDLPVEWRSLEDTLPQVTSIG